MVESALAFREGITSANIVQTHLVQSAAEAARYDLVISNISGKAPPLLLAGPKPPGPHPL